MPSLVLVSDSNANPRLKSDHHFQPNQEIPFLMWFLYLRQGLTNSQTENLLHQLV